GAHAAEAMCAGCHKITDPIGLTLEGFDGAGGFRQTENGEAIDASGTLDGVKVSNAVDLGRALHDHPSLPKCLVDKVYGYATGNMPSKADAPAVAALNKSFADDGFRIAALFAAVARSDAFDRISTVSTDIALEQFPTQSNEDVATQAADASAGG